MLLYRDSARPLTLMKSNAEPSSNSIISLSSRPRRFVSFLVVLRLHAHSTYPGFLPRLFRSLLVELSRPCCLGSQVPWDDGNQAPILILWRLPSCGPPFYAITCNQRSLLYFIFRNGPSALHLSHRQACRGHGMKRQNFRQCHIKAQHHHSLLLCSAPP